MGSPLTDGEWNLVGHYDPHSSFDRQFGISLESSVAHQSPVVICSIMHPRVVSLSVFLALSLISAL